MFMHRPSAKIASEQRRALLAWYDQHHRPLPWRPSGGKGGADVYAIWLAEIMSQQTTITAMRPYHEKFLQLWPTVQDLAAAERDAVLGAWAGLGYYARARNLHACAQVVAEVGGFPNDLKGLRALPGVGDYTAAAIAAQAYGQAVVPVDGNVERVMARMLCLANAGPKLRKTVTMAVEPYARSDRAGDFAQSLMELGALVCRPKTPKCEICPWARWCQAHDTGQEVAYPKKPEKRPKPQKYGALYLLCQGGDVAVEKRPDAGLLGGYWAPPTTAWTQRPWPETAVQAAAPVVADWRHRGTVQHTFTHFSLDLQVWVAEGAIDGGRRSRDQLGRELPSVFRKALAYLD